MEPEIIAAIIGGIFLLASTAASIISLLATRRTSESVEKSSGELAQKLEETARVTYVEGERDAHDSLTKLTLKEEYRVNVTRFSPKSVQRQSRYFSAIRAKLMGSEFEESSYGKLEKYNRLTSLCSQENKESLILMIQDYLKFGCDNFTLRVTADKNDFELLIFEKSRVAALCFHDLSKQDVVHSCIIVTDRDMYVNFYRLYQKVWNEDILLEIDFSKGEEHVLEGLEVLKEMDPIEKSDDLSPMQSMVFEAERKIAAARLIAHY